MRSQKLIAFAALCLQACASASDDAGTSPERPPEESSAQGDAPFAINEAWRDACRSWCGVQQVLNDDCVTGEAVLRGARLGTEPFPDEPPKSYDVDCVDECLAERGGHRCWQQQVELKDCLARTSVFICAGDGSWTIYGCESAGSDPAVCGHVD